MSSDASPRWLFLGGCPRSGTTALAFLLDRDERFAIGIERFKFVRRRRDPFLYRPEILTAPISLETNLLFYGDLYGRMRERFECGTVAYVGDKYPYYFREMEELAEVFDGARFVMTHRDVVPIAASYRVRAEDPTDRWAADMGGRQAAEDWNDAMRCIRRFDEAGHRDRLFVVRYEQLFAGDEQHLDALMRFLKLPVSAVIADTLRRGAERWRERMTRPRQLPDDVLAGINEIADRELESWITTRIEGQAA